MYGFMIAAFMISFLYTETDCGTLHKFPLRKRKVYWSYSKSNC